MKITDPQVIEDGEKDLITAVQKDLDLNAVKQILKDRMEGSILASRGGQIVVHNNKIAFRLDFDINLSGSLLFDREGNYIDDAGEEQLLAPAGDPKIALEKFEAGDLLADEEMKGELSGGIPLVDTGLDDTDTDAADIAEPDLSEQDLEDTLSIGLPEYDLEEDLEYELELTDKQEADMPPLNIEVGELEESEWDTKEPENMAESDEAEPQNLVNERLEDRDLENDAVLQEEMLDDDINGILKESRDFWEQKKDS